jgi:hypothetical protein
MFAPLLIAAVISAAPPGAAASAYCSDLEDALAADSLRALYESGQTFSEFLAAATGRKELWHANSERSSAIDTSVVAAVRAIRGPWRILAVAVDGCSDSVNTLPYIARLAELVDGLDLRIVNSTAGRAVMEAHRTADGRAATPTLVLLDADWNEVGCFIERPPQLQLFMEANKDAQSASALQGAKMDWYDTDAGRQTLEQVLVMLQGALAGQPVCR